MKYKVNVEELLSRIVEVEAENEEEAEDKVREMYMNEDIVLDASDFQSVEYFVQQKKVNRILCLSVFWRWLIITAEEKLLENGYEDVKYLTNFSYDDALIGITHDNRAVYDYGKNG